MKFLGMIDGKTIGLVAIPPANWIERKTARAILYDTERRIALLHSAKRGMHHIPGGGIDDGETVEMALRRESLEEAGCRIKNIRELGQTEEWWNDYKSTHQISYCLIAEVDGAKGTPHFDKGEVDSGYTLSWHPLEEAIALLESEKSITDYDGRFTVFRDLIFLQEALRVTAR